MDRRVFGKTVAALLSFPLLPEVRAVHAVPTVDLEAFCSLERGMRYGMTRPFIQRGLLCATDCRIGVRMFDAGDYANREEGVELPPLFKPFDQFWKPTDRWMPWPQADYALAQDRDFSFGCWRCRGTGVVANRHACNACSGEGYDYAAEPSEWPLEESPQCKSCLGTGWAGTRCDRCQSRPYDAQLPSVAHLDGREIQAQYHAAIARLPDVEFVSRRSETSPVVFRFQGGQGLVMPIETVE